MEDVEEEELRAERERLIRVTELAEGAAAAEALAPEDGRGRGRPRPLQQSARSPRSSGSPPSCIRPARSCGTSSCVFASWGASCAASSLDSRRIRALEAVEGGWSGSRTRSDASRATFAELLERVVAAAAELEALRADVTRLLRRRRSWPRRRRRYRGLAGELRDARRAAAAAFAAAVAAELRGVGMGEGEFRVELRERDRRAHRHRTRSFS